MPITMPPLTRRRFLAGSLGLTAGAALTPCVMADSSDRLIPLDPDRVALLADTHISGDPKQFVYGTQWPGSPIKPDEHEGVIMADCLAHVVRDVISQNPRPGHAIVNGDCALSSGHSEEYREFIRLLKPMREAGIIVHITIGNHDNRTRLWQEIPGLKREQVGRHVGVVELPKVNLLLLDTGQGDLGEEQLVWLGDRLGLPGKKPILAFAHINPYRRPGTRPIKGHRDGASLLQLLTHRKNVKALFYGHTHNWTVERWVDVHMINQPPVSYCFGKGDPNGWIDMRLTDAGGDLELRCINEKHPRHKERHRLLWREG